MKQVKLKRKRGNDDSIRLIIVGVVIAAFLILSFLLINKDHVSTNTRASANIDLPAVITGAPTQNSSWPYMVSIFYTPLISFKKVDLYQQHFCGGVLINREWILTAAHCVNTYSKSNLGIAFKVTNLKADVDQKNIRYVQKMYIHEKYLEKPTDKMVKVMNDLALLKLDVPYDEVAPVTLNKKSLSTYGSKATILGWGYTKKNNAVKSEMLQAGDVTISYYSGASKILTSSTATMPYLYDSGGPLIGKDTSNTPYLVGVISASSDSSYSAYYVDVASYISDWINVKTGLPF